MQHLTDEVSDAQRILSAKKGQAREQQKFALFLTLQTLKSQVWYTTGCSHSCNFAHPTTP